MLEEKKITIEVPASTGNVGPGFDCIGLAVDIWNKVTIEKSDGAFEILNQGISKEKYDSIPNSICGFAGCVAFRRLLNTNTVTPGQ